jgi:hypothetical protein
MNTILNKIAAVFAFIIGGMAIFAGGNVLLGNDPGYYVINWLPLYNYTMGILTLFIIAPLIWASKNFAMSSAIGAFSLHAVVMLILQTAYQSVVAPDSIRAMTLRLTVWLIILVLMFFQARKNKTETKEQLYPDSTVGSMTSS